MYKNILVPVSFEAGRDAHRAMDIANALRADDGTITILHVLEHLPQYASSLLPADHLETARKTITEKLTPLADGIAHVEVLVVEGHSGRTILDHTVEHACDCIVITSHRPGMQDYFLGSTAARVVRHASCAVHVVR
ncbi:universal stress protein [Cohaesibacter celericrescens]|uniref:Universal stress protein n=1 Tax=Cohaesibacter celericrescens TaxID=2067669 RepID=A0A2N5XTZ4_9HYPH|nr:universal stress protein [Cohaesibacter celericrescens]PLW77927.1 universal stress protein [Cohaesibacter celericrescens]